MEYIRTKQSEQPGPDSGGQCCKG